MIASFAVLLTLVLAAPEAAAGGAGPCLDASRAQMAADTALLKQAQEALRTSGFAGVAAFESRLQAMVAHAPTGAQPVEACNTRYVVHASSLAEGILTAAMVASDEKKAGGKRNVVLEGPYPYATAALYLGSLATERHDFARAAEVLRRGLTFDPQNALLASELSTTLSQAHHNEEALAVADRALAASPLLDAKTKGLLQRRRGFALTEMRRLDDAEAAYRQALDLDPTDQNAKRELTYIAQQRAGAPPSAITATAPAQQVGKAPAQP